MIITLHGISTLYSNTATDIRIAGETGYAGIEFDQQKLLRYLDHGNDAKDLIPILEHHGVEPRCINALKRVELQGEQHQEMIGVCERLCAAAEVIGCPVIQVVPFEGLAHLPWKESFALTAGNIKELAQVASGHGIGCQLEVLAWAPICSLQHGLELIDRVGMDNVQMVIDFWHLWAGGETTPDDVAKLDKQQICGVHFSDGKRIPENSSCIETDLRGYLGGDGDIPLKEWVDAVKATGFVGTWSSELISTRHWEWDLWEIARETKRRMMHYIINDE